MPGWMDYSGSRDGYAFADEIAPEPGDIVIEKPTASSFYRTDLEEQLRAAGIDTLIVTGGATAAASARPSSTRTRAASRSTSSRTASSTAARSPTR